MPCHPDALSDHPHTTTGNPCHHAAHGPVVCRNCPGWINYRCVCCGIGGPTEPLHRNSLDGALYCWSDLKTAPTQLRLF